MHVVVQCLFDEVLWLVAGQLGDPGGGRRLFESHGSADYFSFKLILVLPTNQVLKGSGGGGMLILEVENDLIFFFLNKKKAFELSPRPGCSAIREQECSSETAG